MKLGLNTFVYEMAAWSAETTIRSAAKLGFRHVEWAAWEHGDPTRMSDARRKDLARSFRDEGLASSQVLLTNLQHFASSDETLRRRTFEYMQRVGEFQRELGGRQVLVCWGCGVREAGVTFESQWMVMVEHLRRYAEWALAMDILVDLELDPHVYFIVNDTVRMTRAIEDVGMPNVHPNVDIGHLCITREPPRCLEKLARRMLHVHLSETDTFAHTNSILGTGKADFGAYLDAAAALGIEENCARLGEPCVAGIEMGEPGVVVDDPERWVTESLAYLGRVLPKLTRT